MGKVSVINHCDNPACELGYLEYECPICHRTIQDYGESWFDYQYETGPWEIMCEECNADLLITNDNEVVVQIRLGHEE